MEGRHFSDLVTSVAVNIKSRQVDVSKVFIATSQHVHVQEKCTVPHGAKQNILHHSSASFLLKPLNYHPRPLVHFHAVGLKDLGFEEWLQIEDVQVVGTVLQVGDKHLHHFDVFALRPLQRE